LGNAETKKTSTKDINMNPKEIVSHWVQLTQRVNYQSCVNTEGNFQFTESAGNLLTN
jgi:hypothetical protein